MIFFFVFWLLSLCWWLEFFYTVKSIFGYLGEELILNWMYDWFRWSNKGNVFWRFRIWSILNIFWKAMLKTLYWQSVEQRISFNTLKFIQKFKLNILLETWKRVCERQQFHVARIKEVQIKEIPSHENYRFFKNLQSEKTIVNKHVNILQEEFYLSNESFCW